MNEEAKEVKMETPVLTFGDSAKAVEEEKKAEEAVQENLKIEIDDSMLSEAEKKAVESFANEIDLRNTQGIMEYGSTVQKKMADFSQDTLNKVRTKDMGAVGTLLTDVVTTVKTFDASTEEKSGGFFGLFRKAKKTATAMKAKYDDAEANINKICDSLETHQVVLLKDVAMLDKMYDLNMATYKEITMYILAGKKKLEEVKSTELQELKQKAEETGKAEDAQAYKDLLDQCTRFEKKLYDLDLTRTISMQTAPQIRMLQSSDTQMAEKIQSVIVNTIPLWKNQMVIALGIQHSTEAIQAESAVTDATNELLKKNAESLHVASVQAEKANQRGIVDIETLKHTNEELLNTLTDVMRIQEEGREKREAAEQDLRRMEQELKSKLLEMGKK
ncbi:MAG: toxic anion resistance protein [Lachnospiraceae bacterium]|nr:toxic anion resistance protein [Lachnospiraceae bacterium]